MLSPWDWVLWEHPRFQLRQPDLAVVTYEQAPGVRLTTAPLLAVEVLSPTSIERDTIAKRDYARAGLDHYWVVDPAVPQLAVFRRTGDRLELFAHADGEHELDLTEPITAIIRPIDLCS
jgi:Uma2 family endonuclease